MPVEHVIMLMLENRSFDCMLGMLYPGRADFDGLTGAETNIWHKPDGAQEDVAIWADTALTAQSVCVPDPDPGEAFTDIDTQIHGMPPGAPMGGFVDDYMRETAGTAAADPRAVMHYFTPAQVPVISQLARAFGVSDRWHASAPCQTWPNRFFVHTCTAGGYVNNMPAHVPFMMPTVFGSLQDAGHDFHIYFHDMPQSAALGRLWLKAEHFSEFADFVTDAASGNLPAYSFIEPRYFSSTLLGTIANDEHPPHNVAYGEALIAQVYNAVRGGPLWDKSLLLIIYDEHGGCFDHVSPPAATPPDGNVPDGFEFDRFGVRVPAVIVSPYIAAGSVVRPAGAVPFDHTTVGATLGKLFGFPPLTARDTAAPDLLGALGPLPANDGPPNVVAPAVPPTLAQVAQAAAASPNNLQQALAASAALLPPAGVDLAAHAQRLAMSKGPLVVHRTVGQAASVVAAQVKAFRGR